MSELDAGGAPAPAAAPAIDSTPSIDTAPPAVGAPEPAKEPEQVSLDDTLNAAWDKAQTGVERGDNGKFVAALKPETAENIQNEFKDGLAKAVEKDSAVQPETAPEPISAIEAPQSWTAEAKAKWAKLPPDTQEYILSRESEAHKAISAQGTKLRSLEPFEKVLTEYQQDFARHRVTPDQGIRALLEAQRMFDQDPLGAATTLLAQRGIDLRAILSGQQQAPTNDPMVGQLRSELASVRQELQQYVSEHQTAQQRSDAAVVQEFAKQTDANGKPLRPYFEEVREDMAALMQIGKAETLEAAYEKACKLNDTVFKRIETDQRKAAAEKRTADEAAKQAELKKVNVKSGTAHPSTKTMDDTLAEIARRAYG
jgi:hypothetical protein